MPTVGATDDDKRQYNEFQKQIDYWVNWRDADGKRAFVVPVGMCSTDAEVTGLDKISFAEWLRQNGFNFRTIDLVLRLRLPRRLWIETRSDIGLGRTVLFLFASQKVRRRFAAVYHISRRQRPVCKSFLRNGKRQCAAVTGRCLDRSADRMASMLSVSITASSAGLHCENVIYAAPMFTAPFVIRGLREMRLLRRANFNTMRGGSPICF